MKRILALTVIALFLISCGGTRVAVKKIVVPDEVTDNFTNPSLSRFINDNPGASVVVRIPSASGNSAALSPARVCALIEQGLMRERLNPKDRIMFENTLAKMTDGSDYVKIKEVTGTDLIFEVTQCDLTPFGVEEYLDQKGNAHKFLIKQDKKTVLPMKYILWGYCVEIKVILLADNLIAGIYKYYNIPCNEKNGGGQVVSYDIKGLRYTENTKTFTASESSLVETKADRFDKELSEFITKTVVPTMFEEMKKGYTPKK